MNHISYHFGAGGTLSVSIIYEEVSGWGSRCGIRGATSKRCDIARFVHNNEETLLLSFYRTFSSWKNSRESSLGANEKCEDMSSAAVIKDETNV